MTELSTVSQFTLSYTLSYGGEKMVDSILQKLQKEVGIKMSQTNLPRKHLDMSRLPGMDLDLKQTLFSTHNILFY